MPTISELIETFKENVKDKIIPEFGTLENDTNFQNILNKLNSLKPVTIKYKRNKKF